MSATRPPAFDDRLSTPIEASRRGAHRARPKPVSAGLPVIAGVVVVLLVIGGAYTLLSNDRNKTSSGSVSAAGLGDDDPTTGPSGSPAPGVSGVANSPATVTGQSTAASPTKNPATLPSPSDDSSLGTDGGRGASANRSINLVVLNSTTVHGLAKKVQTRLEAAGWKVSRTGNSLKHNLSTTKIYYATTSQKATATALVSDLGYGIAVQDASVAAKGLVVVLGQDSR